MPYRRLPNTDQARIRSLKAALTKGDASNIANLALSLKTLGQVRSYLRKFELAHTYYMQCYDDQAKSSPRHQTNVRMARLYISHFIQVLNLAVIRGEVKQSQKSFYGLPADNSSLPDLTSESALVEWGRKIIDGEQKRIAQGGIPIYSPTIAKVKVHYDLFLDTYKLQKGLQKLTNRRLEQLADMRPEADALILDVWNQVEETYAEVSPNEHRLDLCREYGLIYYYRTGEKLVKETY